MPLIIAAVVAGGTFFGWMGQDISSTQIRNGHRAQAHWLELKQANIQKVALETLSDPAAGL